MTKFRPPQTDEARRVKLTVRVTDAMEAELRVLAATLGYTVMNDFYVDLLTEGLPLARREAAKKSGGGA